MWDDKFIAALAAQILALMKAQAQQNRTQAKTEKPKIVPRLLTVREAAVYLGRSVAGVEHLIHRKQVPVVRRGRRVHLDRESLDKWIEGNTV
jgi:excisionase family DNA binding protein